ncbi:TPA: aminoglycoside adenylyltransferase family protein [Legionella pneumophila]
MRIPTSATGPKQVFSPQSRIKYSECIMNELSYSDKQQISQCLALFMRVLGDNLLGVYLYGSAVIGGLQPYSDIDLLVVTHQATTAQEQKELVYFLLQLSGVYMKRSKRCIEMTLIQQGAVNPWRYPPHCDFQYGEWLRMPFEQGTLEPQDQEMPDLALLITQVLLKSQTLFGPSSAHLLAPVPTSDCIQAMLHDVDRLVGDVQDDTRNVVLTLARIWNTLETHTLGSKSDAADWVMPRLPERYQPILRRAQAIYRGEALESWNDLTAVIKPYAQWMSENIKTYKTSQNLKKITYT